MTQFRIENFDYYVGHPKVSKYYHFLNALVKLNDGAKALYLGPNEVILAVGYQDVLRSVSFDTNVLNCVIPMDFESRLDARTRVDLFEEIDYYNGILGNKRVDNPLAGKYDEETLTVGALNVDTGEITEFGVIPISQRTSMAQALKKAFGNAKDKLDS